MKKMQFLAAAVALGLSMCAVGVANAAYPEDKDITVIIPKNPGGGTDITARGLITMMQQDLGNANLAGRLYLGYGHRRVGHFPASGQDQVDL